MKEPSFGLWIRASKITDFNFGSELFNPAAHHNFILFFSASVLQKAKREEIEKTQFHCVNLLAVIPAFSN